METVALSSPPIHELALHPPPHELSCSPLIPSCFTPIHHHQVIEVGQVGMGFDTSTNQSTL